MAPTSFSCLLTEYMICIPAKLDYLLFHRPPLCFPAVNLSTCWSSPLEYPSLISAQGNAMTLPSLAQFPPFCEVFIYPPGQKPFLFPPVLLCFMFLVWGAFLVAQRVTNLLHCGRPRFVLGSERFPGEGNGYRLQYSCLENPMDTGTWWATVHGVTKESDMT